MVGSVPVTVMGALGVVGASGAGGVEVVGGGGSGGGDAQVAGGRDVGGGVDEGVGVGGGEHVLDEVRGDFQVGDGGVGQAVQRAVVGDVIDGHSHTEVAQLAEGVVDGGAVRTPTPSATRATRGHRQPSTGGSRPRATSRPASPRGPATSRSGLEPRTTLTASARPVAS